MTTTESIPLTLRKSNSLDDWYVIERLHHDGNEWLKPIPHGMAFCRSARFSDNADVEGTGAEMLAIASAIKQRKDESFKRCSVTFLEDGAVAFESPRNSEEPGIVTVADADALADLILSTITQDHP